MREAMVVLFLLAACGGSGYPRTRPDSKHRSLRVRWVEPARLRLRLAHVETCELGPVTYGGGCDGDTCDDWTEQDEIDCHPMPIAGKHVRARVYGEPIEDVDLGGTDRHGYVFVTGELAKKLATRGGDFYVGKYRPGVEL